MDVKLLIIFDLDGYNIENKKTKLDVLYLNEGCLGDVNFNILVFKLSHFNRYLMYFLL